MVRGGGGGWSPVAFSSAIARSSRSSIYLASLLDVFVLLFSASLSWAHVRVSAHPWFQLIACSCMYVVVMSMFRRRQDVSQEDAFHARPPCMPPSSANSSWDRAPPCLMPMSSPPRPREPTVTKRAKQQSNSIRCFISRFFKFVFWLVDKQGFDRQPHVLCR